MVITNFKKISCTARLVAYSGTPLNGHPLFICRRAERKAKHDEIRRKYGKYHQFYCYDTVQFLSKENFSQPVLIGQIVVN